MHGFMRNTLISTKIYLLGGLLILLSVGVGVIGVATLSRFNTEVEHMVNASQRAQIGEKINAMILSVVADSRGIYMAETQADAKKFADSLKKVTGKLDETVSAQKALLPTGRTAELDEEETKVKEFVTFRNELARLSQEESIGKAREFGDNDANRNNRKQLNELVVKTSEANAREVSAGQEALRALHQAALRTLTLTIILGALAGFVFAYLLVRFGILSPLHAIRQTMLDLAGGRSDVDIPGLDRGDELGSMAHAVEVFKTNAIEKQRLDAAQAAEQKAKEARQKKIDGLLDQFKASSAGVVSNVSAAATELSLTAEQMNDVASRTSNQAYEVACTSQQTSTNVQSVASAAEELSASTAEIASQVGRSTDVVREAMHKVATADTSSQELVKTSESISAVTSLIESIAGQINLLALNATIESARAGEAGKGFAVVASEVKNLATQASKATDQIRQQLSTVQNQALLLAAELSGVKAAVEQVTSYSGAIAAAVEQQSAATREIVANMQTASGGVDQINHNVSQIKESADNTTSSTQEVLDAAKLLSQQSEVLNLEVQNFLQRIHEA